MLRSLWLPNVSHLPVPFIMIAIRTCHLSYDILNRFRQTDLPFKFNSCLEETLFNSHKSNESQTELLNFSWMLLADHGLLSFFFFFKE